jgi:thiamine biosynthesis lipoprotein
MEIGETFACFGSQCAVAVAGGAQGCHAAQAVARVRGEMLAWHERFTRFEPTSELSALNGDERMTVRASAAMRDFVRAVVAAGERTEGLVDATLLDEVREAGYGGQLGTPLPLGLALRLAPARRPAAANPQSRLGEVSVDETQETVTRPLGVRFDSGGLAKGMMADRLADQLADFDGYAIGCAGDLRIGGRAGASRVVEVTSPFDDSVIASFALACGGIATSGIGKRSWLDGNGRPAHHLIDPGTGRPAYTGIVQVTALASSALDAEIAAKAALLSGLPRAEEWLPDGGALVLDDGSCQVITPAPYLCEGAPSNGAPSNAGFGRGDHV